MDMFVDLQSSTTLTVSTASHKSTRSNDIRFKYVGYGILCFYHTDLNLFNGQILEIIC